MHCSCTALWVADVFQLKKGLPSPIPHSWGECPPCRDAMEGVDAGSQRLTEPCRVTGKEEENRSGDHWGCSVRQ